VDEGLSLRGVARVLGLSYSFVRSTIIELGIPIRRVPQVSRSEEELMLRLYREGHSIYEIARILRRYSPTTIYKHIKKYLPLRKRREYYTRFDFRNAPKDVLSYLAGAILGDGHIATSCVMVEVKDKTFAKNVMDNIKKLIPYGVTSVSLTYRKNRDRYVVLAYGRGFSECLKNYEEWLRNVVLKYPREYLRGLYEAEGSFNISSDGANMRIYIEMANKFLIETAAKCLDTLEIDYRLRSRFRYGNTYWILEIRTGKHIWRFMDKINPCIKNLQDFFTRKPERRRLIPIIRRRIQSTRNLYRRKILLSLLKHA